jgi:hypothetical protein
MLSPKIRNLTDEIRSFQQDKISLNPQALKGKLSWNLFIGKYYSHDGKEL